MEEWVAELQNAVRSTDELLDLLELDPSELPLPDSAGADFPLLVPRSFVSRMEPGNPRDPLLLQVLPRRDEEFRHPAFTPDPLEEEKAYKGHGLLKKYKGRALLVVTGTCPVHCRYCFRQNFDYGNLALNRSDLTAAIEQIATDGSLVEVILSGGDPLSLSDARLKKIISMLAAINHVRVVRIHTRFPVMVPSRITTSLLECLASHTLRFTIVVHVNHPNEIDASTMAALRNLRRGQTPLLNQSVLLSGVNADIETLTALSWRLYDSGVLPYYVHLLDRVPGTSHFEIDERTALSIYQGMLAQLPGYLVPRFVREVPGHPSKVPLPFLDF